MYKVLNWKQFVDKRTVPPSEMRERLRNLFPELVSSHLQHWHTAIEDRGWCTAAKKMLCAGFEEQGVGDDAGERMETLRSTPQLTLRKLFTRVLCLRSSV